MDFGIVNPATKVAYSDIPADLLKLLEDVVLNRRHGASEELIEVASQMAAEAQAAKEAAQGELHRSLKRKSGATCRCTTA